jgi:hypothetical protein
VQIKGTGSRVKIKQSRLWSPYNKKGRRRKRSRSLESIEEKGQVSCPNENGQVPSSRRKGAGWIRKRKRAGS